MTICTVCGATRHTQIYCDDRLIFQRHIEICDRCLFQHVAYHYPNDPLYSYLLYYALNYFDNFTPLEALITLPQRSITHRLAEIPFTISYWAHARKD